MSQSPNRIAGRYELLSVCGQGGMATVWQARAHGAVGFNRIVAIKEIKPEYGAVHSYVAMFVEEARISADLSHANIIQVYDFVVEHDIHYLVMEWVEGLDLGAFLRSYQRNREKVPWWVMSGIGIYSLRGLSAAHERCHLDGTPAPVIHRDVSPPNILLGINGTVKLSDFGLARARDRVHSLTIPGTVKGKLSYLSPEVAYGKPATPHSDLFSLGTVLWESLVGRRLFAGPTEVDIFSKIRKCRVPPLGTLRPDVPKLMVETIHKALQRDPENRFATADEMTAQLVEVMREYNESLDLQKNLRHVVTRAHHLLKRGYDYRLAQGPTEPRMPTPKSSAPPEQGPQDVLEASNLDVSFPDSQLVTRTAIDDGSRDTEVMSGSLALPEPDDPAAPSEPARENADGSGENSDPAGSS